MFKKKMMKKKKIILHDCIHLQDSLMSNSN